MEESVCKSGKPGNRQESVWASGELGDMQESVCDSGESAKVLSLRAFRARVGGNRVSAQQRASFVTIWNKFGISLGPIWSQSGTKLGQKLGLIWDQVRPIWDHVWDHFGQRT